MNILIVDDEALARQRLERMLRSLGHEVTAAENAQAALEAAAQERFDAAFLDIEMPDVSGIDLGYDLRYRHPRLFIVFQTAHDEHALEAFDIGATGYLVKPYSLEQLTKTMERVKAPSTESDGTLRLLSKNGENYYLVKPEEIYYVKADLSEVILRTDRGFSYLAKKISDLETLLQPYPFFRVHRSYLINTDRIKAMETVEQSRLRFTFEGISDEVESSKDGAKHFRNRFSE